MLGPIAALFDMIEDADRSSFALRGESNLFRCYEQEGQAHRLMSLLSQKELMLSLCTRLTDPIGVLFGTDTDISELKSATIVLARVGDGKREFGRIGVIGPTRMDYKRVITVLRTMAQTMSDLLSGE
jgi:heat-inducible transcriptional repressor